MAGFTKKFVKRELIITLKSHNNNFPSVVFTLLRCVYGCLWPACACVCVHIFSTTHINCRSLLYKLDDVQSLLAELPVSVLVLTETWFDSNYEEFVKIPGYRSVLRSRVDGGGGGVGFLVREGIVHQCLDLDKLGVTSRPNTFECLFIQLNFKRGSCIMGVVYRPPGQNLEEFNIEIDHLLTEISKRGKD